MILASWRQFEVGRIHSVFKTELGREQPFFVLREATYEEWRNQEGTSAEELAIVQNPNDWHFYQISTD